MISRLLSSWLAIALCFLFCLPAKASRCETTLESLSLSGPALKRAQDLSRLSHEIDAQNDKALQGILREELHRKVDELVGRVKEDGKPIDRELILIAIRNHTPSEKKEEQPLGPRSELPLVEARRKAPKANTQLGSYYNRHQQNAEEGWESVKDVPVKLIKRGQFKLGRAARGTAAVLSNGGIVIGSNDSFLHHLEVNEAGELVPKDKLQLGFNYDSTPVVTPRDTILVAGWDGHVYHLGFDEKGKFTELGKKSPTGTVDGSSLALLSPDLFAMGSRYHGLQIFQIGSDGHLIEREGTGEPAGILTALPGDIVISGNGYDGVQVNGFFNAYRVGPEGKLTRIGRLEVGNVRSAPTPLSDGRIAALSTDGKIHILDFDAEGLKHSGSGQLGKESSDSPVVELPNGRLAIGADDELLRVFTLEVDGGLTNNQNVPLSGRVRSAPTLLPSGHLSVSAWRGYGQGEKAQFQLFALDPNGDLVEATEGFPIEYGSLVPPTILKNRRVVVVGGRDFKSQVYLLEVVPDDSARGSGQ